MGLTWGSRRLSEQLADDLGHARRLFVGCNFQERDCDKVPLFHPRMRNLQARFADPFVSVYKNIQVQRARPIADTGGTIAPELLLDRQQLPKKRTRIEFGLQCNDRVEKPGLVRESHRLSGVKRRSPENAAEGCKPGRGRDEGRFRVAGGAGKV